MSVTWINGSASQLCLSVWKGDGAGASVKLLTSSQGTPAEGPPSPWGTQSHWGHRSLTEGAGGQDLEPRPTISVQTSLCPDCSVSVVPSGKQTEGQIRLARYLLGERLNGGEVGMG